MLLGIDYGLKRVGVAVSDQRGAVAFPRDTFSNDKALLGRLSSLIQKEHITAVVIGDSRNAKGDDNPINSEAKKFGKDLQHLISIPIFFEPEFYTSAEARQHTGKKVVDAEAAAIILNSYITRNTP